MEIVDEDEEKENAKNNLKRSSYMRIPKPVKKQKTKNTKDSKGAVCGVSETEVYFVLWKYSRKDRHSKSCWEIYGEIRITCKIFLTRINFFQSTRKKPHKR